VVTASEVMRLKTIVHEADPEAFMVIGQVSEALGEGFKRLDADSQQNQQRLMEALKNFKDIILVTPPLWMLKNIASGDDRGFFEQLFLRALLWEKNVSVALDFGKPKFRRGTFFQELNDALGALEEMGAAVVSLELSVGKPEGELPLVTQAEVADAKKRGKDRIRCAPGAIVTPLARDAAKELGVTIDE
jgi:hypothetical protein